MQRLWREGCYSGNSECSTKTNIKEGEEAFRDMKQGKNDNNPPYLGDQKALVNAKDASCSLMMGSPTK